MFEYIQDAGLSFKSPPAKRKKTLGIVLHHRAGWGDVLSEHEDSLARGWIGIGYNIFIRQDGTVWWGRGLDSVGAHCGRNTMVDLAAWLKAGGNNSETIGIGFEGYYHPGHVQSDRVMPKVQFDAGVKLIRDLLVAFPTIAYIKGHRYMLAVNTVCPGDYFPLDDMIYDAMHKAAPSGSSDDFKLDRCLLYFRPNMTGTDVKELQKLLNKAGAVLKVDGAFGPMTRDAVIAYQKKKRLTADGVVGPVTIKALGGAWEDRVA